jgi:hypothetical protein
MWYANTKPERTKKLKISLTPVDGQPKSVHQHTPTPKNAVE